MRRRVIVRWRAQTIVQLHGARRAVARSLTAISLLGVRPPDLRAFLGAERRTFPSARHDSGSGFLCLPAVARSGPMVRYQDSWHASLDVSTLAAWRGGRPADSGISCCAVA